MFERSARERCDDDGERNRNSWIGRDIHDWDHWFDGRRRRSRTEIRADRCGTFRGTCRGSEHDRVTDHGSADDRGRPDHRGRHDNDSRRAGRICVSDLSPHR